MHQSCEGSTEVGQRCVLLFMNKIRLHHKWVSPDQIRCGTPTPIDYPNLDADIHRLRQKGLLELDDCSGEFLRLTEDGVRAAEAFVA